MIGERPFTLCIHRILAAVATLIATLHIGIAYAETSSLDGIGTVAASSADEEVVVKGRMSRAALRVQIELAEEAFFERFNEINSHDDFDIHCKREVQLGSRIPKRVCRPKFWHDASARIARETLAGMQGSAFAGNTQHDIAMAHMKEQRLQEEIRELVNEDAELRDRLARVTALQEEYSTFDGD